MGTTNHDATAAAVLDFWFGSEPDDARLARERAALWWGKQPDLDRAIRERFEALRARAVAGALATWEQTPRGRLALILLIDQFSRNMYRDDPRAFADDPVARGWTLAGLERGQDRALRPVERMFFYLPLEHSERLDDQEQAVALFQRLLAEAAPALRETVAGMLDYARRHRDIIARFGRFPHRNRVLGRESTAAELAFLKQPGSSF